MKILNMLIWGINWFGLIISFILGFLYYKYRDIIAYKIKGIILLYKMNKKNKYNDFYECNIDDSDFMKGNDKDE